MNKLGVFVVIFVFFACASNPPQAQKTHTSDLESQLNYLADQIVLSLEKQEKSKIAVIEFSNLEGKITKFGRFLAEELITRLFRSGQFEVIERHMLDKVLNEHKLSVSGMIDAKSAMELGKILGIDALASGTVTDLGNKVKVNARLISAETGKVFSVASVNIIKDEVVQNLMTAELDLPPVVKNAQNTEKEMGQNATAFIVEKEGFILELQKCVMKNRRIICHLKITNTSEDDKEFKITYGWQYKTQMFDDLGNEYVISAVKMANKITRFKGITQYEAAKKKIIGGTSVTAELHFTKVSSQASKISLLQLLCGFRGFKAEFRDIDIIK